MVKSEKKLTKNQVRILRALACKKPMSKEQIRKICSKTYPTAIKFSQWIGPPLGSNNKEINQRFQDRCGYPSLLTLGYVTAATVDVEQGHKEVLFTVTPKGLQALKATKAVA